MNNRFKLYIFTIIISFLFVSSSFPPNVKKFQLLVFEGSDWCSNCIRLEKNVLSQHYFQEYLLKNEIELLKIDFPQRKKLHAEEQKANDGLAEKYEFKGVFPTLILARTDTLLYSKIYYKNHSAQEIVNLVNERLERLK